MLTITLANKVNVVSYNLVKYTQLNVCRSALVYMCNEYFSKLWIWKPFSHKGSNMPPATNTL